LTHPSQWIEGLYVQSTTLAHHGVLFLAEFAGILQALITRDRLEFLG
jgi:hypothetical protein